MNVMVRVISCQRFPHVMREPCYLMMIFTPEQFNGVMSVPQETVANRKGRLLIDRSGEENTEV